MYVEARTPTEFQTYVWAQGSLTNYFLPALVYSIKHRSKINGRATCRTTFASVSAEFASIYIDILILLFTRQRL
jgi:hypothetical protein